MCVWGGGGGGWGRSLPQLDNRTRAALPANSVSEGAKLTRTLTATAAPQVPCPADEPDAKRSSKAMPRSKGSSGQLSVQGAQPPPAGGPMAGAGQGGPAVQEALQFTKFFHLVPAQGEGDDGGAVQPWSRAASGALGAWRVLACLPFGMPPHSHTQSCTHSHTQSHTVTHTAR